VAASRVPCGARAGTGSRETRVSRAGYRRRMGPLGLVFELILGWAATSGERERRGQELSALGEVAHALGGRLHRPWFGRPWVEGRLDGRDVQVEWLGQSEVVVGGVAPAGIDLHARRAWWWRRLLSGDEAEAWANGVEGARASERAERRLEAARGLIRGEVARLDVQRGRVRARVRPLAFTPASILTALDRVMTVCWSLPPEEPAASPAIIVRRPAATDLRCPFCHDVLAPEGVVVHCASCDAPHHPTCFEEGNGCSIQGCAQRVARGVRTRG
jgi:hypothetical protein